MALLELKNLLTLSGGICVAPYSASSVKELLENTDMAVYNAKRSGKNNGVQRSDGRGKTHSWRSVF